MFTVISLAIGGLYEEYAKSLAASINRVGIDSYRIYKAPDMGSWEKNCQYKAVVLRRALDQFDTPIIWIDADAEFKSYPFLFKKLTCDFAYYYFSHTRESLSGTLYIANNERTKEFLDLWIEENSKNERWDQVNMSNVLSTYNKLDIYHLPIEYCKIFDNKHQECENPIIVHNQASREAKRLRRGLSV